MAICVCTPHATDTSSDWRNSLDMHFTKPLFLFCVLLAAVLALGGWQSSRPRGWEYAVVEVGSVSQMTSNVFFLDHDGYHSTSVNADGGHSSGSDSVSTNTDLRLRMAGKALSKLGNEGW